MIQVSRLGYAVLSASDVERQVDYYVKTLGLSISAKERGRTVLATRAGEEALILEPGGHPNCTRLGLQVSPDTDLKDVAKRLSDLGLTSDMKSDVTPLVSAAVSFRDPKGTEIEIFKEIRFADLDSSTDGIKTRKLGHVAFHSKDAPGIVDFYCKVLGFRVSDWRTNKFAFLRCGRDHHALNFVQADSNELHHVAFELPDQAEIIRSMDLLAQKGIPLAWGPLRHNIGHSISTYHRSPDELTVELFTDLDVIVNEELGYFEPRPWHQDRPQRPQVWPEDTSANAWGVTTQWQGPAGFTKT